MKIKTSFDLFSKSHSKVQHKQPFVITSSMMDYMDYKHISVISLLFGHLERDMVGVATKTLVFP